MPRGQTRPGVSPGLSLPENRMQGLVRRVGNESGRQPLAEERPQTGADAPAGNHPQRHTPCFHNHRQLFQKELGAGLYLTIQSSTVQE